MKRIHVKEYHVLDYEQYCVPWLGRHSLTPKHIHTYVSHAEMWIYILDIPYQYLQMLLITGKEIAGQEHSTNGRLIMGAVELQFNIQPCDHGIWAVVGLKGPARCPPESVGNCITYNYCINFFPRLIPINHFCRCSPEEKCIYTPPRSHYHPMQRKSNNLYLIMFRLTLPVKMIPVIHSFR